MADLASPTEPASGLWRRRTPGGRRALVKGVDSVVEEWKRRGMPVWSPAGILCTPQTYKKLKMTFAKRASLRAPSHPLNSRPVGRAIDIRQHANINKAALKDLGRGAAVAPRLKSKSR